MTLIDRLLKLARLWAAAQDRSLPRLATIVANDGKFFDRLEGGATCTVAKFESFLLFFREPGNWPESQIPADAAVLLDEVEMIATGGEASAGKELRLTSADLAAAAPREEWPLPGRDRSAEIAA